MFVEVAVLNALPSRDTLTYSVPEACRDLAREGQRVLVPLGFRRVTGIILSESARAPEQPARDILEIPNEPPVFDAAVLELCRFAARYYLSSLGDVLSTAVPSGLRVESQRRVQRTTKTPTKLSETERRILDTVPPGLGVPVRSLTRRLGAGIHTALRALAGRGLVELIEEAPRSGVRLRRERRYFATSGDSTEALQRAPVQRRVLKQIVTGGPDGISLADLGGTRAAAAVRSLVARALVRTEEREVYRTVVPGAQRRRPTMLTSAQSSAIDRISEATTAPRFETFLLRGVTGSGKTEVYLRVVERVHAVGRGAILLVPEIALTEELVQQVVARFGTAVALLHSALSPGERWDEWRRLIRREARILVGVRSAVFAPMPDLGVIIVDEEHDGAYKQDDRFRYHARDLAIVRARDAHCPIVLGSATPSIESYAHAQSGRYVSLELPDRVESRPLPSVEVIDRRGSGGPASLSPELRGALEENLAEGGQSLLFLNRRGFAHYLQCIDCGHSLECPQCSISLTFHLRDRTLRCHHCNHRRRAPDECPDCGNPTLRDVGSGTEQVERAVREALPAARVARMDRDTMGRKGAFRLLLDTWRKGELDVVVGTQMVTKGHNIPGLTLVGVIAAEQSLHMPDFRAGERTFQLLTQVAGRAGRAERPGRVLIQTYRPDHPTLQFACRHDFLAFAAQEIAARRELGYPPFSRLVNLRFEGADGPAVERRAAALAAAMRAALSGGSIRTDDIRILGPAPAPIERLRGRYRWQLLLKGRNSGRLRRFVGQQVPTKDRRPSAAVRIIVDVDPYGML